MFIYVYAWTYIYKWVFKEIIQIYIYNIYIYIYLFTQIPIVLHIYYIFSSIGIWLNCISMEKCMHIPMYNINVYPCKYIFGVIGIVLKRIPIEIGKVYMGKSSHIHNQVILSNLLLGNLLLEGDFLG